MSFSSYNPNDRYRQRASKRMTGILSFLFFFALIFGAGFWVGEMRSRQITYILQEDKREMSEDLSKMQNDVTSLRADAQTANVRLEQLKANYDELTSEGPMKRILALVRQQIEQGVSSERLESVISMARPPQNCSTPETKRFVVTTPVYNGPDSVASVSGGLVVINARGESAQNVQGNKEAWFDPSQSVEISFQPRGGEAQVKEGVLPIYHSVVVGAKEYRFTVTEGAKSFVKVTYDHCDYP